MSHSTTSKMKIYALPLVRLGPKGTKPLVYFHSYLPPPPTASSQSSARSGRPEKHPLRQQLEDRLGLLPNAPLPLQLTTKASSMWTELGHADTSSWKAKAHRLGERLMDRIECEEWSLKAVERGLVPPGLVQVAVDETDAQGRERVREAKTLQKDDVKARKEVVQLFYPPQGDFDPSSTLRTFLEEREPLHAKRMKQSILAMPVASLFGIIPIIPNFPFMYVAWRTWSHWKARNAATLLGELLSADRIRPTPSQRLDGLLVPPETVGAEDDDGQAGRLLVSKSGIEKLVKEERLPEASLEELMRAFMQAEARLAALPPPGDKPAA